MDSEFRSELTRGGAPLRFSFFDMEVNNNNSNNSNNKESKGDKVNIPTRRGRMLSSTPGLRKVDLCSDKGL